MSNKKKSRTTKKSETFNVPDHRHCPICGKVIPPNLEYCSTKCESIALKRKREEEFARKLLIFVVIIFFVTTILSIFLRK